MEGKNKRSRSSGSSSVGVSIAAFLLGFLFAFIVLIGGIFGVGYVAVTTDINEVLSLAGLDNKNKDYDETDPDSNKYNYINADKAPNVLALISEVMNLANAGLGELNLNKIDALAPVTETVLNFAYDFIDGVVDFDKDYFQDVPLTSIIDSVTNSVYYVHTAKVIELLNTKMGYSVNLDDIPIASYLVNGVEAQYATINGGNTGGDENYKLPVLFDYYVSKQTGIQTDYYRTISVGGISAFHSNLNADDYICETKSTNSDGKTLYKAYYVPCKVTPDGIEEADYEIVPKVVEDPNVTFTKDGETVKLKYVFNTISYGADTDFIAVKPEYIDGVETFTLDYSAIMAAKNSNPEATADNRYLNYSYYSLYARNYYSEPELRKDKNNDRMYGISTINGINFFKNVAGEVVEYDALTVSDVMLSALEPLYHVPVTSVVGKNQAEVVRGIFGDTSLGAILNNEVKFKDLINDICISTFLTDVKVTDKVMAYIIYNISDITDDGNDNYTAVYDKNGENIPVKIEIRNDGKGNTYIEKITDTNGKEIKGNTVSDLSDITDNLTLDIFMEVKADDAIMAYLGYGITDVVEVVDKDWQYEGVYGGDTTVRIYTDSNKIITNVTDVSGKAISGTTINQVSDRVNNVMNVLTLPDVIDVDPSNAIMAYIGYGITDVEEVADKAYAYTGICDNKTVYIYVDTNNYVTKVTDTAGKLVSGTAIDNVSSRIEGIMDVLTLPDLIDIEPDNAIMAYIGYGIYDLVAKDGTNGNRAYNYTGTYKQENTEVTVYIATKTKDANTYIASVWKDGNAKVKGTKINDVSTVLDNMTDAIAITEFIDIDATDAIMAYLGYGVYDVVAEAGEGYTHTGLCDVNGVATKVFIATQDSNGTPVISSVWYVDSGNKVVVSGTKIGKVADRLNNITDTIAITEFIDIDATDAIMAYLGYGVYDVAPLAAQEWQYEGTYGQGTEAVTLRVYTDTNNIITKVTDTTGKEMGGTKIGKVSDRLNSLQDVITIGDIIDVDSSSSKILQAIADKKISELDDTINTLTVSDVLKDDQINNNSVLPQLRNTLITELGTEIDKVIIQRIYAKEIYGLESDGDPALAATFNPAYLYYEKVDDGNGGYKYVLTEINCEGKKDTEYDNALGKLTQDDWDNRGDKQYYTYGAAKGMWKLVLYRVDGTTKTEKAYTLNNFNAMVNACSTTVYNSTLGELKEAGIISSGTNIDKYMKFSAYYITIDSNGNPDTTSEQSQAKKMSELTLKQLLDVVITYMGSES